jgi:two-component system, LuxR family, sensor kinase FixL
MTLGFMPDNTSSTDRISISRKVKLGVGFTLVMLILIVLVSFVSTRKFLDISAAIAEGREILEHTERVQRLFMEMESGVRGFLLSGNDEDLNAYDHGLSFIIQELQTLRQLTSEAPEQQARISRLQGLVGRAFAVLGRAIERRREGGLEAAAKLFTDSEMSKEATEAFAAVRDELNEVDQAERVQLSGLREDLSRNRDVNSSLIFGGAGLTFIALIVAALLVLRDIAERRRAEEALAAERNLLRRIMDTIPDLIFVKDLQGRYTRDNLAHRRHLGIATEEEVAGKSNAQIHGVELATRYTLDDDAVLRGERTLIDAVEPGRTADGRLVWLETTKVPLVGPDGKSLGLVGVSSDITQRRADEEKLKHFAAALQRSNEELQNFASVASHDLQEPLRKIQSFGNLLSARHAAQLGEQGTDYLKRMMDAAERMQTLIQDLLKLSRVTTRAQPFQQCNLGEILRGVLSDLEVKITSTGARVSTAGLGTIEADPTQMRQLFQNLVANALKFQTAGVRPEVLVTARIFENLHGELPQIPHGAKLCEVQVKDNGIGFDPQFGEQIFSPFKRLHTRQEYEGSGIGLTVCRKITDRHHGRIVAQSTSGQGATFIVTLPVNQPETHERRSEAHYHPDGR